MPGGAVGRISSTVILFALLGMFATACAKTEHGDDPAAVDEPGGVGGADQVELPPKPTCMAGSSCRCSSGVIGETHCRDDFPDCDCTACPPYSPDTAKPFFACGGSVAGSTWVTRSYDLSGLVTYFGLSAAEDTAPISCRSDFSELAAPDLRLVLNLDGSAEVAYTAPEVYGTVLEACLQQGLGRSCEQIPNCSSTGCGTCGCNLTKPNFSSAAASWSENKTILTVGPFNFDYCVEDEILSLRNRDNEMRFELERM